MDAQLPRYIDIVFAALSEVSSEDALHEQLGGRFAVNCQDLGTKHQLDPGTIADFYGDPEAYCAGGTEVDFSCGLDNAEFPVTFKFKRLLSITDHILEDAGAGEGYNVALDPSPVQKSPVAELVLECIYSDGASVQGLPISKRLIVFPVASTCQELKIGRAHQPGFFENLVQNQERLLCISRTHFAINVSQPSTPDENMRFSLMHMSKNPLKLDNTKSVHQNEDVLVDDGTWIGFRDRNPSEGPFLVMRLDLRSQDMVNSEGSLLLEAGPSAQKQRAAVSQAYQTIPLLPSIPAPIHASLECDFVAGLDITVTPRQFRRIGLPLGAPVAVGRVCQPGFFEQLLSKAPQWLSFISGRQCELTLSQTQSWLGFGPVQYRLGVENLSRTNIVMVEEKVLGREESDELPEAGTLSFAAANDGRTVVFMKFRFEKVGGRHEGSMQSDVASMCSYDCLNPPIYTKRDESGL